MKKLLVIALIALFIAGGMGVVFAAGPSGPGYAGDIAGMATGRMASDAQRTFRLVHVSGANLNTQITADAVVVWDTNLDDGVSVMVSNASGDTRVAGVMVATVTSGDLAGLYLTRFSHSTASDDIGLRNWGWMQTYGLSTGTPICDAALGIGVGELVVPGGASAAGAIGVGNMSNPVAGATGQGRVGFAMDAIAAGGTGQIFIKTE